MKNHDRLLAETKAARAGFLSIPLLRRASVGNVPRTLYLEFLRQAYHHVRHTCPLLALAAAKTQDPDYRAALLTYLEEERGHDDWILSDIAALGGEAAAAARSTAREPCRIMVGYAYYAIEWISPYALLGMVHVLESMSALLASQAAQGLKTAFDPAGEGRGFVYLASHGELDAEHTEFFADLVDRLPAGPPIDVIIDTANLMYWLYGNIFRDLQGELEGRIDAARR